MKILYKVLFILFISCIFINSKIHNKENRGLNDDIIGEIRESTKITESEYTIMNALCNNEFSEVAANMKILSGHNEIFSHKIDTKGITDQKKSGRCWLFAGLNMLRPYIIKKYNLQNFEFSQNFLYFWSKMEKANFFLESIMDKSDCDLLDRELELLLKRPVYEGGLWSYVVNLVNKYGLVPKDVMPETYSSEHPWVMNALISKKLREDAAEIRKLVNSGASFDELKEKKIQSLKSVYKMLTLHLGEPPENFYWRYENVSGRTSEPELYTPEKFYLDVLDRELTNYVAIMNYPGKEYRRLLQFNRSRNVYELDDPVYANVDIGKLKGITLKSIFKDDPVWFACDIISESYFKRGILTEDIIDYNSLYGFDMKMDKEERIIYRESSGNHAMVFTGVDIEDGKPVKWLVEDSHGIERGSEGHWTMYDDWFNEYLYVVVIHKKYLTGELEEIFREEPIHLPPWDPMIMILKN